MIEPLRHRILIQVDAPPTETDSGLYIPDEALKKETVGTVINLGKDADKQLKIGSRVMFGLHDGVEIGPSHCDGMDRCLLIADSQIKCILGTNNEK